MDNDKNNTDNNINDDKEAKKKRKNELQRRNRALQKKCFELIEANPKGDYTKEQWDNRKKYMKSKTANKTYNQIRKRKAGDDPVEKERQLKMYRINSHNYRMRVKSKKSTDPSSFDKSLQSNRPNETIVEDNHSFADPLVVPQVNESNLEETVVEQSIENSFTTYTSSIQMNLINNNAVTETSNNTRVANSPIRKMLQSSQTESPRNNDVHHSVDDKSTENLEREKLTQFDYNQLNDDEIKMISCLEQDLFLWGVSRTTDLSRRILDTASTIIKNPDDTKVKSQCPIDLPSDIVESFKIMLDKEVEGGKDSYSTVVDKIEMISDKNNLKLYGRPYVSSVSDNEKSRILKMDFNKDSLKEFLDPTQRFSLKTVSKKDHLIQSFTDNKNCLDGYVFELMFAHYLQHKNVQCKSCKSQTLRWNGGSGYPWMDVVCTTCNSTYEIKSKNNIDIAFRALKESTLEGGCFPSFQNICAKYSTDKMAKQYVIVVSRTLSTGSYPAYQSMIAMIRKVYPIINTKSFADLDNFKFKSKIIVTQISNFVSINKDEYKLGKNQSWMNIASGYLQNHSGLL